jgi:hypothetical protein
VAGIEDFGFAAAHLRLERIAPRAEPQLSSERVRRKDAPRGAVRLPQREHVTQHERSTVPLKALKESHDTSLPKVAFNDGRQT